MKIIELNGVTKTYRSKVRPAGAAAALKELLRPVYREVKAVNGVSFDIEEGEILGFIGPNGAGKSTTLKMLSGILTPTSGRIRVMGMDPIADRGRLSFSIGAVFGQKSQLWIHLPPVSTFRLLGDIYEIERKELGRRIEYLTEVFKLSAVIDKPVRKLSLGERVKCEIAASLLHKPKVLFLDEPTIGLDIEAKNTIRDLIMRLNRDEKTTIILTSHDVADIERLCSRLIIIDKGSVVVQDSLENIRNKYLDSKVITLRSGEEVAFPGLDLEVLSKTRYKQSFRVDLKKHSLRSVLERVAGNPDVEDVLISELPLEEIILKVYKGV